MTGTSGALRPPRRRPLLLAAVCLLALGGSGAQAVVLWYQHYERGLELADAEKWREALEELQAAAAVEGRPRAQIRTYGSRFIFDYDPPYHQARCLVELGRLDEAAAELAAAEDARVTDAADLVALRRRLETLRAARSAASPEGESPEPKAPRSEPLRSEPSSSKSSPESSSPPTSAAPPPARLVVDSTPSGAAVTLDGRALGRTPLSREKVAVGAHRLRLTSPGFAVWEQEVEAVAGEALHLDVALLPQVPAVSVTPAPPTEARLPPAFTVTPDAEEPDAGPGSPGEAEPGRATAGPERAPPVLEGSDTAPIAGGPPEPAAAEQEAEPRSRGAPWASSAALLALAAALGVWVWRRRRGARRGNGSAGPPFERLGGYRVIGELGRGGMATTYRARRLADGKEVALKIPHQTGDPTYLPRFLREGRLGETLHHPGIVRILEAGQEGDVAFLAMELVPGRPLKEEIEALPEGLPLDRALEIARAIAEALDYAHSKGVVHRDLKPENIMLLPDGSLKVMDFGVARVEGQPGLTTSQFFFGSPLYAAPELVEQPRTIDHRADLYSLGVLLYELLEGRPPFFHESIFKLLEMHQREPLPEPETLPRPLPPEVWALLGRLLEKDPACRYGSAQELLVDLNRWLHRSGEEDRVSHGAAAAARVR